MFKKIIEKIIIICAVLSIGFIAVSNIFYVTDILNDVTEVVNIHECTSIMIVISIVIAVAILRIMHINK